MYIDNYDLYRLDGPAENTDTQDELPSCNDCGEVLMGQVNKDEDGETYCVFCFGTHE